jgi:hypothetical protein
VTISASPQSTGLGARLFAGAVIALLCAGSRRRHRQTCQIVGLSLVLMMGGFEGAIHSVHHLGDAGGADRCLVASSSEHFTAVDVQAPDVVNSFLRARDVVPQAQSARARTVRFAPDAGRAPPA